MEDSRIEFMDKRTFSQLAAAEARTCEAPKPSSAGFESEHLPCALACVSAGQAGYCCLTVILLDLLLVFVLAIIEKYGDEWPERKSGEDTPPIQARAYVVQGA